jgi:hypothetical protein
LNVGCPSYAFCRAAVVIVHWLVVANSVWSAFAHILRRRGRSRGPENSIYESNSAVEGSVLRFRSLGISWPPLLTEKVRGLPLPVGQIPGCQFERQLLQRSSAMGCQVGNRSSHRRSFRVRNDLPGWENTGRPLMRLTLCNILAVSPDRRDEYGRPATNHFEDIDGFPDARWTRMIFTTELAIPEAVFLIEFHWSRTVNRKRNVVVTFRCRSRDPIAPWFLERWQVAFETPQSWPTMRAVFHIVRTTRNCALPLIIRA